MIGAAGFLLAAGLLAVARSAVIAALNSGRFPWGTLAVNVSGSFLAGLVVALAPASWSTLVGIAALGAFTTFSTFAVELAAMWSDRPGAAATYGSATTVLTVAAAALGLGL
jgi:CrcB protein